MILRNLGYFHVLWSQENNFKDTDLVKYVCGYVGEAFQKGSSGHRTRTKRQHKMTVPSPHSSPHSLTPC